MKIALSSIAFFLIPSSASAELSISRRHRASSLAVVHGNVPGRSLVVSECTSQHEGPLRGGRTLGPAELRCNGLTSQRYAFSVPRGGGGKLVPALNPTIVSQIAAILTGLQGLVLNVAPKKCNELYGLTEKENNPLCVYMSRQVGTGLLAFAVTSLLLISDQVSVYQAVRISALMFLYEYARLFMNNGIKTLGFTSAVPLSLSIAYIAFSAYAVSQPYAKGFVQVYCVLWGLIGLLMILAPQLTLTSWGLQTPVNAPGEEFTRLFGYYLVASAASQGAMTQSVTPLQAFGFGIAVFLVHHLDGLLVRGDYKKTDKRNARLFWIAVDSLVAITSLI